ncbi:MAG: hypothetical protein KAI94_06435, partial [Anaerolineales bacterium]|nr:hypothetical protein [Anaerolineales bacterium]
LMSVVNVDVSGVVGEVAKGLDALFTSDEERDQARQVLAETMQQPHIMQAMANIESAKSTNWFVAGGRPALLWICAIALFYNWILKDLIVIGLVTFAQNATELVPLLPTIDGAEVTGLVLALLGLAGIRGYERVKGVAREP